MDLNKGRTTDMIDERKEEKSRAPEGIQSPDLKSFALQTCATPLATTAAQVFQYITVIKYNVKIHHRSNNVLLITFFIPSGSGGGGLVVNLLAFYSGDPGSNPASNLSFLYEKTKIIRAWGVGPP